MKKLLAAAVVLPFFALGAPAIADNYEEEGKIATMNTWSITLENGMLFEVGNAQTLKELKPGDTVKVNYVEPPESSFIATKVERRDQPQK